MASQIYEKALRIAGSLGPDEQRRLIQELTADAEEVATAPRPASPYWLILLEFVVHTVVGFLIFSTIAAPAVALDFCVRSLEALRVSSLIIAGLRVAEYALFATDLFLFIVFLVKTAVRTAKRL